MILNYNERNLLTKTQDALLGETNYTYFPDGKLKSVKDAKNQETGFTYNQKGLLETTTDPENQTETLLYDGYGNMTQKTKRDGTVIEYFYNEGNELIQKNAGGEITDLTYDKDSLLTSVNDADSQVLNTYNYKWQLIAQTQSNYPGTSVEYEYYENGRKSRMRFGALINLNYFYTNSGIMNRIEGTVFGRSYTWERNLDELQRPIDEILPNGVKVYYSYDAASQLTGVRNEMPDTSVLSEFGYTYDLNGNRSHIDEIIGGLPAKKLRQQDFTYDELNRLTSATAPDEAFSYDSVGNRINEAQVYDNANRLMEDTKWVYSYDLNGNMTGRASKSTTEVVTYTRDNENRIVQVVIKEDGVNPSKTLVYKYDGLGRRIERFVTNLTEPAKSYTRKFIYDGEDILCELDGSDNIIAVYMHAPGIDNPIGMYRDVNSDGSFSENEAFFYTKDALGSVRDITDKDGNLVQRYRYSSYGITTIVKVQNSVTSTFIENSYAYTGREIDWETGDYFYRARYYRPEIGRFLSEDPITLASGDFNAYRYVFNQPINMVDPSGYVCEYKQSTGEYSCWYGPVGPSDPYIEGTGYSGAGVGLNNPSMEQIHDVGPIPRGQYSVGEVVPRTPSGLRDALPLTPSPDTNTYGRSGFFIHGDNPNKPSNSSSQGCPIINRNDRLQIPSGELFNVYK